MDVLFDVLVNRGKHGLFIVHYDREKPEEAFYKLFLYFDGQKFYRLIPEDDKTMQRAYRLAKSGDKQMAQWLVQVRSASEYEGYYHEAVY